MTLAPEQAVRQQARADEAKRRLGYITDEWQIECIAARVAYGQLGWWRRLTTPAPDGWRRT